MESPGGASVAVSDEVRAEAGRLASAADFPAGYVARVRTAAQRLAVTEGGRDDVRSAALLLEQQAVIDVDVPVASRTLPQRLVKQMVRKLVGWYVRFLAHQVGILGQATGRFALVVAERLDRLEAADSAERAVLQAQLSSLEARVAELEARPSTPPEPEAPAGASGS